LRNNVQGVLNEGRETAIRDLGSQVGTGGRGGKGVVNPRSWMLGKGRGRGAGGRVARRRDSH